MPTGPYAPKPMTKVTKNQHRNNAHSNSNNNTTINNMTKTSTTDTADDSDRHDRNKAEDRNNEGWLISGKLKKPKKPRDKTPTVYI